MSAQRLPRQGVDLVATEGGGEGRLGDEAGQAA